MVQQRIIKDRIVSDGIQRDRLGYPLSLSDAGNMIGTGYGRVICIFPYVGDPIKKKILEKSTFFLKSFTFIYPFNLF